MNSTAQSLRTSLIGTSLLAIVLTAAYTHNSLASRITPQDANAGKTVQTKVLPQSDKAATNDIVRQLAACRASIEGEIKPRCGWISR